MTRSGSRCRNKKKRRKTSPRFKGKNLKRAQCSFSSLTFSDDETEFTASEGNPGSESSDRDHGRRHRSKRNGTGLQVIHVVKNCFQKAVNYRMYRLDCILSKYDHAVSMKIRKLLKRLTAHMNPHTFDPFDSISTIGFL